MREVEALTRDRTNTGLYVSLCRVLPDEAFHRIVSTIKADQPANPRAVFVRMAKEELKKRGLEIPAEAKDGKILKELL
jgi:hypothetical protein